LIEQWLLVAGAALLASTLAAIAGTGGGIILLPVLVAVFGVREAVPMYAVAQFIGNMSRVAFNWRLVELRVVLWFCAGAIPAAALGAWLFTQIPDSQLLRILGGFLVVSVVWRHWRKEPIAPFAARWFAPVGAVFAVVSAIVGSAGPFLAPFYLTFGLVKGAFIGTEALATAVMHVAKLASYQGLGAISADAWLQGALIGPVMVVGSLFGKLILERLSVHHFMRVVEVAILGFGLWFLVK
jgi:uncharacterized protein